MRGFLSPTASYRDSLPENIHIRQKSNPDILMLPEASPNNNYRPEFSSPLLSRVPKESVSEVKQPYHLGKQSVEISHVDVYPDATDEMKRYTMSKLKSIYDSSKSTSRRRVSDLVDFEIYPDPDYMKRYSTSKSRKDVTQQNIDPKANSLFRGDVTELSKKKLPEIYDSSPEQSGVPPSPRIRSMRAPSPSESLVMSHDDLYPENEPEYMKRYSLKRGQMQGASTAAMRATLGTPLGSVSESKPFVPEVTPRKISYKSYTLQTAKPGTTPFTSVSPAATGSTAVKQSPIAIADPKTSQQNLSSGLEYRPSSTSPPPVERPSFVMRALATFRFATASKSDTQSGRQTEPIIKGFNPQTVAALDAKEAKVDLSTMTVQYTPKIQYKNIEFLSHGEERKPTLSDEATDTLRDWGLLNRLEGDMELDDALLLTMLDSKNSSTSKTVSASGYLYDTALRANEAELERLSSKLGDDHPEVLSLKAATADLFKALGMPHQAEILLRQVLESQRKVLGARHQDLAESLNDLSLLLIAMHEYRDALDILEELLVALSSSHGPIHPDVACVYGNLAIALRYQSSFVDCLAAHEQCVSIMNVAYGPDHPETLFQRGQMGVSLVHSKASVRGKKILTECLDQLRQANIPECHPWVTFFSEYVTAKQSALPITAQIFG